MTKKYIEQEAAIETFEQAFDNNWEVSGTLDRIRAIPAADVVERKKGKWERVLFDHQYFGCRPFAYCCSECHQLVTFRTFFCPNCGADLREADNG